MTTRRKSKKKLEPREWPVEVVYAEDNEASRAAWLRGLAALMELARPYFETLAKEQPCDPTEANHDHTNDHDHHPTGGAVGRV